MVSQPLGPGSIEGSNAGSLQDQQDALGRPVTVRLFDYADGQTVTVIKWVANTGPVPLTITRVGTVSPSSQELIGISDARAVPVVESQGCCPFDDPAPWKAPFRPLVVQPGHEGALILHVLMSHCEYSSPGGQEGFSSVPVYYRVLGIPRATRIDLYQPVYVAAPATCPRTGPARPAASP